MFVVLFNAIYISSLYFEIGFFRCKIHEEIFLTSKLKNFNCHSAQEGVYGVLMSLLIGQKINLRAPAKDSILNTSAR